MSQKSPIKHKNLFAVVKVSRLAAIGLGQPSVQTASILGLDLLMVASSSGASQLEKSSPF